MSHHMSSFKINVHDRDMPYTSILPYIETILVFLYMAMTAAHLYNHQLIVEKAPFRIGWMAISALLVLTVVVTEVSRLLSDKSKKRETSTFLTYAFVLLCVLAACLAMIDLSIGLIGLPAVVLLLKNVVGNVAYDNTETPALATTTLLAAASAYAAYYAYNNRPELVFFAVVFIIAVSSIESFLFDRRRCKGKKSTLGCVGIVLSVVALGLIIFTAYKVINYAAVNAVIDANPAVAVQG